ncbi:hypothetical protein [Mycolicibacterium fortuitum]|uniref:hypothetical protein n=1 Tax=Mycolicibacterium fortuitum TaxID=1766 RepID=UPI001CDBB3CF|nr:hypothetical protein [Mycolicibacterium fortuitum]UBV14898.1 hypothetical protein H8Z57_30135 [Mycolicibacterium fortuitum]
MTENAILALITLAVALGIAWWINRSSPLAPRTIYGVSVSVWAVVVGVMVA